VAPDVNRFLIELGPFSRASTPAFKSLGDAADVGGPALAASQPTIKQLAELSKDAIPVAGDLAELLKSLRETGGMDAALDFIFYGTTTVNSFDSVSHYLRTSLLLNLCSQYSVAPAPGCSANFPGAKVTQAPAGAAPASAGTATRATAAGTEAAREQAAALQREQDELPTPSRPAAGAEPVAPASAGRDADPALFDYLFGNDG